jgi:hypothetical protein
MNLQSLVPVVLVLQFAVYGWRINREISLDDQGRRTWLLIADYLNFICMLAVLALCIIVPIVRDIFTKAAKISLAVAFVLVIFYPIILAGHYRLFSKDGRSIYAKQARPIPHVTDQEWVLLGIAVLCMVLVGFYAARWG